jgi:hypothetical protein
MQKNNRLYLIIIGVSILVTLCFVLLFSSGSKNKQAYIQTGGDFTTVSTEVIFKNSNAIYNVTRSADIESLRSLLATKINAIYGNGKYIAYVKDNTLHYSQSIDGMPPSYWFEVDFEKIDIKFRIDVNMQTGNPQYTTKQL